MQIAAIQTAYKGYNFRSRLEARWAVFFDALGINWEYEPEGFVLPDGTRYLPDFKVKTHIDYWVEIKGTEPTCAEMQKMSALCKATNTYGHIFFGMPADNASVEVTRDGEIVRWIPACGRWTPSTIAFAFTSQIRERTALRAITAASSARFEFGQKGATL